MKAGRGNLNQIVLTFTRRATAPPEYLELAAEHVLDALIERAQFVAWGPAVSADFDSRTIEVECTVEARQSERAVDAIADVVRCALGELEGFG